MTWKISIQHQAQDTWETKGQKNKKGIEKEGTGSQTGQRFWPVPFDLSLNHLEKSVLVVPGSP